jgi:hypothetical protein
MNDHGKSDRGVVPTKRPNKDRDGQATSVPGEPGAPETARPSSAEVVEGSRLAKGNTLQRPMLRTQRRVRMSHELGRVRQAAKQELEMRCRPHQTSGPVKRLDVMTQGRSPVR